MVRGHFKQYPTFANHPVPFVAFGLGTTTHHFPCLTQSKPGTSFASLQALGVLPLRSQDQLIFSL